MKSSQSFKLRSFILFAALLVGFGVVTYASAQHHAYIIDLSSRTVADLGNVDSHAINGAGQVVGQSGSHAFITGPNGVGMTHIGIGEAYGVNAAGQVVGLSDGAFITGPNGVGLRNLGIVGGVAFAINNAGQVVGWTDTAGGARHAFITGHNGVGMTDLGTLGGFSSLANSINAAGQVVGDSLSADNVHSHAFITGPNGVGMTDLGTLGAYNGQSSATGINDAGQVVGYSTKEKSDGHFLASAHAFITGPNGVGMTDLGTLGGGESFAWDINDAGQVVGDSTVSGVETHAFVTGPNGVGMTDLNSLLDLPNGHVLSRAIGINNHGQIIAFGFAPAIPEPASYALMLTGLGLIGFTARRRKKMDTGT